MEALHTTTATVTIRDFDRRGHTPPADRPLTYNPPAYSPPGHCPLPLDRPDGQRPPEPRSADERILILTPTGRDATLIAKLLADLGLAGHVCPDLPALCAAADRAGVALIAEEVLTEPAVRCLADHLARQPAWSELPLILLTAPGGPNPAGTGLAQRLDLNGNVTRLERPVRRLTLTSAIFAALRARRHQYQVRDLLTAQETALVEQRTAVRQRDEFLAMLGHELRNPLASLGSCLAVLDHVGWDAETVREHRPVLARQTRHLGRLVDDLLDVARITRGAITLRKAPLDVADLTRRCVDAQAERYRAAGIALTVAGVGPADRPVLVDGDADRLEQVVTNLLTNAAKFTPAGRAVRVAVEADAGRAVVTVADTGEGIPADMLSRVFDLFTQANVSIDRTRGGLGLGLTIVRRLVELHGGTVTAVSDGPGCGSTFSVRLPLHVPAVSAAPANGHPSTQPGRGGRRVLLVEDNPDVRAILRRLLRLWGHDVEVAEDGHQGLDKASSFRPDVVLLDIGLPGLDGYEVARRLRSAGRADLCLIAVTGYGQEEDRARALAAGFDAHLVKPVDPARLSQMVATASRAA